MAKMAAREKQERLRRNEQKWTAPLMDAGWTVVPSVILERQQALGLEPLDLNILLQLARYWWYPDRPPRPSKRALAECIGVDPSTVRRRIARLERAGLIHREARRGNKDRRQETNFYRFDGLIKAVTPFAKELIQTRAARQAEDGERRRRKRPRLELVSRPPVDEDL